MKQAAFPLFETSERGPVILSCLWGGGGGGREGVRRIVEESNGFYWERRISHRQQSLKRGGWKGGHWKTTYKALGRDQVNFIVAQLKSPDPIPP